MVKTQFEEDNEVGGGGIWDEMSELSLPYGILTIVMSLSTESLSDWFHRCDLQRLLWSTLKFRKRRLVIDLDPHQDSLLSFSSIEH